jgi:hypothetical protein
MSNLLQVAIPVVIPAVLAFLAAYQGALSYTGRLRRNVKADVELLAALPAKHPSRPGLEGHVRELVDELIWQEQRRYFPVGRLGWGWTVVAPAGVVVLLIFAAVGATTDSLSRQAFVGWTAVTYALGILYASFVFRRWLRSRHTAALRTARSGRSDNPAGPTTPDPSEGA